MTTLRSSVIIDSAPEPVWDVIRAVADVSAWFPGITSSSGDSTQRTVVLADGSTLVEDIVTLDDELRRMQYRAADGDLPVQDHLGTIDVFDLGDGRSFVTYSTEILPTALAGPFQASISEAVAALPGYVASR